jgi:integrase
VASIRAKARGVWEVRVFTGRDAKGRPTQVSRTVRGTKRDAQRLAAELTMKPAPNAVNRTVAIALDAWVEANLPTWAPNSARDLQSRVAHIKADPIAARRVARLSIDDVERWHARMRREGVGESAIRNRHMALRAALTQATRWGWISSNPAALARLTQPRVAARGAMTPDEVRQVLAAATAIDPAAELALRLAAMTGARRAELAALRWTDLDGDKLTIERAIAVIRRQEHLGDPILREEPTKTGNRRVVSVDSATIERWRAVEAIRTAAGAGPWVFALDVTPPNPDRIGYWWREARRRAGIDTRWRLHDLRHWSATFAIGSGHDIRTVAGRLGHANAAITLKTYAHAIAAADAAVATTLARVIDDT